MADMFDLMIKTEMEECYERMICDIASRDEGFNDFTDLLNFVSEDEKMFVPAEYKDYHEKLRAARLFGEDAKNHSECEEKYACPLSGEEMSTMMKEKFSEDMEDN